MPSLIKNAPAQDARDRLAALRLELLRHRGRSVRELVESSQKAIDESRALLERIARDHPDIG